MNIQKVKELREVIKNSKPEAVDMGSFFLPNYSSNAECDPVQRLLKIARTGSKNRCGSSGCIAGWACNAFASKEELKMKLFEFEALLNQEGDKDTEDHGYFHRARMILGLTEKQASRLFFGEGKGWGSVKSGDYDKEKHGNKQGYIMSLGGEKGKKAILKQLNHMIKTGKV